MRVQPFRLNSHERFSSLTVSPSGDKAKVLCNSSFIPSPASRVDMSFGVHPFELRDAKREGARLYSTYKFCITAEQKKKKTFPENVVGKLGVSHTPLSHMRVRKLPCINMAKPRERIQK